MLLKLHASSAKQAVIAVNCNAEAFFFFFPDEKLFAGWSVVHTWTHWGECALWAQLENESEDKSFLRNKQSNPIIIELYKITHHSCFSVQMKTQRASCLFLFPFQQILSWSVTSMFSINEDFAVLWNLLSFHFLCIPVFETNSVMTVLLALS